MSYNNKGRKIKAEDTKQKIYKSAESLFSSRAYHEVSVDEIVKLAGVAKGSFYVHFESKDAFITSLINDKVQHIDVEYQNFLNSFPEDVPTQELLLSFISKIADVLVEQIGVANMQAVYKAQITHDFDTKAVISYNRDIYKIFYDMLERGITREEFKTDMPVDTLTMHFMLAIRGVTYEWCIRYPDFDYKKQALAHFKFLLKGLIH